ncbi:hypothetical protein ROZALSC1DRAFT_25374, partial [Rozella allomycis CSF55]
VNSGQTGNGEVSGQTDTRNDFLAINNHGTQTPGSFPRSVMSSPGAGPSTAPSSPQLNVKVSENVENIVFIFNSSAKSPADYEKLEVSFFNAIRNNIGCTICKGPVSNNGQGGDINQFGLRLIQVGCKSKACKKRVRLQTILRANNLSEYADMLQTLLTTVKKNAPSKEDKGKSKEEKGKMTQKTISFAKKRPVEEVNESEDDDMIVENEEINDKISIEKNDVDEKDERILKLENENKELKKIIQQLSSQMEALTKQISIMNANKSKENAPTDQASDDQIPAKTSPVTVVDNKKTFASVTATNAKPKKFSSKKVIRSAQTLGQKRGPPAEFCRYHIKLFNSRAVRQHRSAGKLGALSRTFLKENALNEFIATTSFVGNSILEVYVVEHHVVAFEENCAKKGLEYISYPDVLALPPHAVQTDIKAQVIRRLKFLYSKANTKNLKACIIEGLPYEIQNEITKQESTDTESNTNEQNQIEQQQ